MSAVRTRVWVEGRVWTKWTGFSVCVQLGLTVLCVTQVQTIAAPCPACMESVLSSRAGRNSFYFLSNWPILIIIGSTTYFHFLLYYACCICWFAVRCNLTYIYGHWPVNTFMSTTLIFCLCRYLCACKPGWEGKNCEREKNECQSNPCQNDGTCNDRLNGYTCVCARGFAGKGV